MTHDTLLIAAIIFLVLPTVAYGGYFLAGILRHKKMGGVNFYEYPYAQRLFRAGHAHAGVWLVLSLVALIFIQYSDLSALWKTILRYGFPFSALFISGGFFAGAFPLDKNRSTPSKGFVFVYVGALMFTLSCLLLAYGLFKAL